MNMKKTIISLVFIHLSALLYAQNNIGTTLNLIEKNNTTLKSLRKTAESMKLENRTGLNLPDPEIGFDYMWGGPEGISDKQNYRATQSFDIPTISGLKRKVAKEKDQLIEWEYRSERMNILLEAKQFCLDAVYYNSLIHELETRKAHAKALADAQKKRLDEGNGNKLELNNMLLNLSTIEGEILSVTAERNATLAELKRLNGGKEIDFTNRDYDSQPLPQDFDSWYRSAEVKNPVLAYVRQEIAVSKKELAMNKSLGLPTFSAGYTGEFLKKEHQQGISVGMSIPLWSNKNRVRQARAAVQASEARETDAKIQFYGSLETLYQRTLGLKAAAESYRNSLLEADNSSLLKKALDAGEISVLDYLKGISVYYDTVNKALEAEHAYQKAFAELSAVEL